jgi:hypothetical protein
MKEKRRSSMVSILPREKQKEGTSYFAARIVGALKPNEEYPRC